MKPFDLQSKCPKCGHEKVAAHYWPAGKGPWMSEYYGSHPERITRRCEMCGYGWDEATLDTSPPVPADGGGATPGEEAT